MVGRFYAVSWRGKLAATSVKLTQKAGDELERLMMTEIVHRGHAEARPCKRRMPGSGTATLAGTAIPEPAAIHLHIESLAHGVLPGRAYETMMGVFA